MSQRWSAPVLTSLATLALLSGCLGEVQCPEHGGRAWREITTPHFVIKTDVEAGAAREMARDFEAQLRVLTDAVFRVAAGFDERTEIILYDSDYEFMGMLAPNHNLAGLTLPPSLAQRDPSTTIAFGAGPFLGGRRTLDGDTRATFVHELTHRILLRYAPQIPRWANEGLAQYVSTVELTGAGLLLGKPPLLARRQDRIRVAPTLPTLVWSGPTEFLDHEVAASYYLGAWAFIHMLAQGAPEERQMLGRYLSILEQGRSSQEAWDGGPGPRFAELSQALPLYFDRDQYQTSTMSYTPRALDVPLTERPIEDVDLHLLWASLKSRAGYSPSYDLSEVERLSPDNPEGAFLSGFHEAGGDRPAAERDVRAALSRAANESRYLALLADILIGQKPTPVTRTMLEDVTSRLLPLAHSDTELDAAARSLGALGRFDEGLATESRALEKSATCWSCYVTIGRLQLALHRRGEALRSLSRALDLAPDYINTDLFTRLKEQILKLKDEPHA